MTETPAYDALKARRLQIYNLEHVQAIATWDRMTYMPPGPSAARAAAQAELGALIQSMQVAPELDELIARAADEQLGPDEQANLALIERERLTASAVPASLNTRQSHAVASATAAWAQAKAANDWALFAESLTQLVGVVRERAERLGQALGLSRYNALLDGFDRGLRQTKVEPWFAEIAGWLPATIAAIRARQAGEAVLAPRGPFEIDRQKRACLAVMEALGFNFTHGRLDVSVHPFTGGTPDDVRLTTRFNQEYCLPSILAVIHETGHGRYQAGLPLQWRGQPLGEPCSASMHEAQALTFERQLAPTPEFTRLLASILSAEMGEQPAWEPANLQRLMTRVRPSAIRVEADEVTYPAHVILRTEIEIALIEGAMEVGDISELWDRRMDELLAVDTRGDPVRGPLQDIHWPQGMFGYFPAYLIGAMAAAQLFETFQASGGENPGDAHALPRRLGIWLEENVWRQGASKTTEQIIEDVSGRALAPSALKHHFGRRYGLS